MFSMRVAMADVLAAPEFALSNDPARLSHYNSGYRNRQANSANQIKQVFRAATRGFETGRQGQMRFMRGTGFGKWRACFAGEEKASFFGGVRGGGNKDQ